MLLLTDNDIVIKLVLCNLFNDFLEAINLNHSDIYIKSEVKYSLPSQANKKSNNDIVVMKSINQILSQANIIHITDRMDEIISELHSIEGIDSGEIILAAKLISNPDSCYLVTGDKRFLEAIKKTSYSKLFNNRVFTFELAIFMICESKGYGYVKDKIIQAKEKGYSIDNIVSRMSFHNVETTKEIDFECLASYTQNISDFHYIQIKN